MSEYATSAEYEDSVGVPPIALVEREQDATRTYRQTGAVVCCTTLFSFGFITRELVRDPDVNLRLRSRFGVFWKASHVMSCTGFLMLLAYQYRPRPQQLLAHTNHRKVGLVSLLTLGVLVGTGTMLEFLNSSVAVGFMDVYVHPLMMTAYGFVMVGCSIAGIYYAAMRAKRMHTILMEFTAVIAFVVVIAFYPIRGMLEFAGVNKVVGKSVAGYVSLFVVFTYFAHRRCCSVSRVAPSNTVTNIPTPP